MSKYIWQHVSCNYGKVGFVLIKYRLVLDVKMNQMCFVCGSIQTNTKTGSDELKWSGSVQDSVGMFSSFLYSSWLKGRRGCRQFHQNFHAVAICSFLLNTHSTPWYPLLGEYRVHREGVKALPSHHWRAILERPLGKGGAEINLSLGYLMRSPWPQTLTLQIMGWALVIPIDRGGSPVFNELINTCSQLNFHLIAL